MSLRKGFTKLTLGALVVSSFLVGLAAAPAAAQATPQKPNHPVHHGRRYWLDAAEYLSSRADGR